MTDTIVSLFILRAVVTTLAVANTVNVYRISKSKGGSVSFSDEPVVDFSLVYVHVVLLMLCYIHHRVCTSCCTFTFCQAVTVRGSFIVEYMYFLSFCDCIGIIGHHHFDWHSLNWKVHYDMHRDHLYCVDRQRSECKS